MMNLIDVLRRANQNPKKLVAVLQPVIKNVADTFKVDHEDLNENSSSRTFPGWDSLNHLALIARLEQVFKVKFSTSDIMTMTSINSIQKVINKKVK